MKPKVIAILTSDYHLSHKPPIWRSNEPDWYEAMLRPLGEIQELSEEYDCPVLCAGDIFDKWNSPAELINFAMKHLPRQLYAIPGQHDLPNHNLQELYRSSFASLTLSGSIDFAKMFGINNMIVQCFYFGQKIGITESSSKGTLDVALVHDYVWMGKHKYPNAPEEKEIPNGRKKPNKYMINGKYYGYDVIVYGDNHKSFLTHIGKTTIFNCGTLMRRKSDEVDYKPQVGLLYSDGSVEPHYLDISKDKHLTADEVKEAKLEEVDMEIFAEELRKLGSSALDFADAIQQFWTKNKTPKKVKDIILKAMGDS